MNGFQASNLAERIAGMILFLVDLYKNIFKITEKLQHKVILKILFTQLKGALGGQYFKSGVDAHR